SRCPVRVTTPPFTATPMAVDCTAGSQLSSALTSLFSSVSVFTIVLLSSRCTRARSTQEERARADSARRRLLDRDRTRGSAFALGQRQLQHPVVELGDDALAVDLVGEREAPRGAAVVRLLDEKAAGCLLFLFLPHLGADRNEIAVDRDADVFLLRSRNLGADLIVLVVLGDVDADVRRRGFGQRHRPREASEQLGKEIVEAVETSQGIHEKISFSSSWISSGRRSAVHRTAQCSLGRCSRRVLTVVKFSKPWWPTLRQVIVLYVGLRRVRSRLDSRHWRNLRHGRVGRCLRGWLARRRRGIQRRRASRWRRIAAFDRRT